MEIAYTAGSRGVYIGTYRGSCDLGFSGTIDDVLVWNDRPPVATGPVIAPVPDTPTHIAIAGGGSSTSNGHAVPGGTKSQPQGCLSVKLSRKTIPVRRKTRLTATVRRNGRRVAGVRVLVRGKGVSTMGARTDRKGKTKIAVRASRAGRLKVMIRGQKSTCSTPTLRAL
jgi:hypothetical protein